MSSSNPSANGGVWVDLMEWEPDDDSSPTLAEVLDCEYTITTGGDNDWFSQTIGITSYYDGDAPESGDISNNEETWMQTTVTAVAGDQVTFYWKVSSESGSDYLRFYIDDDLQDSTSGNNRVRPCLSLGPNGAHGLTELAEVRRRAQGRGHHTLPEYRVNPV